MADKLLETENEAMSKIVELEKQLMQKNKELDAVRVSITPPVWMKWFITTCQYDTTFYFCTK